MGCWIFERHHDVLRVSVWLGGETCSSRCHTIIPICAPSLRIVFLALFRESFSPQLETHTSCGTADLIRVFGTYTHTQTSHADPNRENIARVSFSVQFQNSYVKPGGKHEFRYECNNIVSRGHERNSCLIPIFSSITCRERTLKPASQHAFCFTLVLWFD